MEPQLGIASNLIDGLNKPSGILEAIMLAIITHLRLFRCHAGSMASQVYSAPSLAIAGKINNRINDINTISSTFRLVY